ncbi:MAG: ribbon-helix-helix domain-containing protein [Clostridium sp.]
MAIGEDKTRIVITVTKDLKAELDKQAKKENRTVANLINTIAIRYLENNK